MDYVATRVQPSEGVFNIGIEYPILAFFPRVSQSDDWKVAENDLPSNGRSGCL